MDRRSPDGYSRLDYAWNAATMLVIGMCSALIVVNTTSLWLAVLMSIISFTLIAGALTLGIVGVFYLD